LVLATAEGLEAVGRRDHTSGPLINQTSSVFQGTMTGNARIGSPLLMTGSSMSDGDLVRTFIGTGNIFANASVTD
jgi:hypothetical protein